MPSAGNRTPERDECDTCSPFLMQQIEINQAEGSSSRWRGGCKEPAGTE